MSDPEAEKVAKNILPAYMDVAKFCIQLSVGILTLSIGFRETVLDAIGSKKPLLISWICFLISIIFGILYLHDAVTRITNYLSSPAKRDELKEFLPRVLRNPDKAYKVMGISFILGIIFLVVPTVCTLIKRN